MPGPEARAILGTGRSRDPDLATTRENQLRDGIWWHPGRVSWWMGLLFAIGSACFALAAIASQWASAPRPAIGVTYFVGSIFFTVAAYLQWRPASWEPRSSDWLASAIQLAGTLFFNVSTFEGMKRGFDAHETNLRVWTPDVFGSICFLVSSELAYAGVCHRWVCVRVRSPSWRIAAVNLVGSIAFGVSAVTSLIEPSTQEPVSAAIANAGTAIGALCFLAGGIMLLPGAAEPSSRPGDENAPGLRLDGDLGAARGVAQPRPKERSR
jgi:predicted membrane channel-forming protein YqfA (hemolysin III family)